MRIGKPTREIPGYLESITWRFAKMNRRDKKCVTVMNGPDKGKRLTWDEFVETVNAELERQKDVTGVEGQLSFFTRHSENVASVKRLR